MGSLDRAGSTAPVRILAACSRGGAGHWQPLVGLLRAAHRRGDEVQPRAVRASRSSRHVGADVRYSREWVPDLVLRDPAEYSSAVVAGELAIPTGRHFDQALLGRVASNVHVEPWVDQHRVLAEANLVVCHGGSGTVFGTVEEGLPLVVIPSFADQFPNCRLVAEHGLGLSIDGEVAAEMAATPSSDEILERFT